MLITKNLIKAPLNKRQRMHLHLPGKLLGWQTKSIEDVTEVQHKVRRSEDLIAKGNRFLPHESLGRQKRDLGKDKAHRAAENGQRRELV